MCQINLVQQILLCHTNNFLQYKKNIVNLQFHLSPYTKPAVCTGKIINSEVKRKWLMAWLLI